MATQFNGLQDPSSGASVGARARSSSLGSIANGQARVILGSAEAAIAGKFVEAAAIYAGHPWALQLRAMNIIYETTRERGATILMPSSMVDIPILPDGRLVRFVQ